MTGFAPLARLGPVGWQSLLVLVAVAPGACEPSGRTAATTWTRHTVDDGSRGADGVRLADVNGDGLPDVATGWEEGGRIRVCLNPGPQRVRSRWPVVTVGKVPSPEDAVLTDLDGDGAVDVVSACEGQTRRINTHWAPAAASDYTNAAAWKTEVLPASDKVMQWMFCLPLQVDGKHGIDLVAGGKGDNARVGWFEAPENPRDLDRWQWHPLYEAGWIMSLVAEDLDGDGDQDIIISDRKGENRGCKWLENPGEGADQQRPWEEHRIAGEDDEVMFLTLADLDRDGLRDIVVAVRGGPLLYLRRTAASPPRWSASDIPLPDWAGTGKAVRVGDVDLDGQLDVVVSCENASGRSGVLWLAYRGSPASGPWLARDISGKEGTKYDLVELRDLDGDGDLDVLTCEESRNLGVIWYENPAR
jgi:hypothetical protein